MKWSQLKKRITELMADSVKKRIDFFSTAYRKAHDDSGRGWITIDKQEIISMDSIPFENALYCSPGRDYKNKEKKLYDQNMFAQWTLHQALFKYLSLPFSEILNNEHPIIRALGMLDKRLGKRKLKTLNIKNEHSLVNRFYQLRCTTESIDKKQTSLNVSLTTHLNPKTHKPKDNYKEIRSDAITYLNTSRKQRNPNRIINNIACNNITESDLENEISSLIFKLYEKEAKKDHDTLTAILLFLDHKTKLLKDNRFSKGIIALIKDRVYWIHNLFNWIPSSHNSRLQFSELSRYLLAKYAIPEFMDNAYLADNPLHQQWFRHIGEGKNIRTLDSLPITLTKKMAHYFMTTPKDYPILGALRWGQVHALGGNARLADALLETRLIKEFNDNDFWLSVFKFLNRHPMLDTQHINPIIDYIWYQKYEPQIVFIQRGVAEERPPIQPNFSMRGRTINSLLREVDNWHTKLGKKHRGGNLQWKKSAIKDFQFIEGSATSRNMKIWRIEELLSSLELIDEGRKMKHCVATYASSSHKGLSSIWTMTIAQDETKEKLVTIEINNKTLTICQVRGKCNRLVTDQERKIIYRWATKEGLTLASYI